jgi:hypothetical protein
MISGKPRLSLLYKVIHCLNITNTHKYYNLPIYLALKNRLIQLKKRHNRKHLITVLPDYTLPYKVGMYSFKVFYIIP